MKAGTATATVARVFTAALSLNDCAKSFKDLSFLSLLFVVYLSPVVAKIYAGTPIIPPANAVTGAKIPFAAPVKKFLKLVFLLSFLAFFFSALSSFLSVKAFLSTLNSFEPILSAFVIVNFVIPPTIPRIGSISIVALVFDFRISSINLRRLSLILSVFSFIFFIN